MRQRPCPVRPARGRPAGCGGTRRDSLRCTSRPRGSSGYHVPRVRCPGGTGAIRPPRRSGHAPPHRRTPALRPAAQFASEEDVLDAGPRQHRLHLVGVEVRGVLRVRLRTDVGDDIDLVLLEQGEKSRLLVVRMPDGEHAATGRGGGCSHTGSSSHQSGPMTRKTKPRLSTAHRSPSSVCPPTTSSLPGGNGGPEPLGCRGRGRIC